MNEEVHDKDRKVPKPGEFSEEVLDIISEVMPYDDRALKKKKPDSNTASFLLAGGLLIATLAVITVFVNSLG
jgi:hypothetical protein